MGFQNIIGTDKSEKAVADSEKNIMWVKDKYKIRDVKCQIRKCDVKNLNQKIKQHSVDAIVTEPYLGPPRTKWNEKNLRAAVAELEQLYHEAVLQFGKVLKRGRRVVMVWPIFKSRETILLSSRNILDNSVFKMISPLSNFGRSNIINLTNRQTIIYGREGQKVWREIVILELT